MDKDTIIADKENIISLINEKIILNKIKAGNIHPNEQTEKGENKFLSQSNRVVKITKTSRC